MIQALKKKGTVSIKASNGSLAISASLDQNTIEKLRKVEYVKDITQKADSIVILLHNSLLICSHETIETLTQEQAIRCISRLMEKTCSYVLNRTTDQLPIVIMFEEAGEIRLIEIPSDESVNSSDTDFISSLVGDVIKNLEKICHSHKDIFFHLVAASKNVNPLLNMKRCVDRIKIVFEITNRFLKEVIPSKYDDIDATFTGLLNLRRTYLRDMLSFSQMYGDNVKYVIRTFSDDMNEYNILVNNFIIPVFKHYGIRSSYTAKITDNNTNDAVFLTYELSLNLDSISQLTPSPQFIYLSGKYPYEVNDTAISRQYLDKKITKYSAFSIDRLNEEDILLLANALNIKIDSYSYNMLCSLSKHGSVSFSEINIFLSSLTLLLINGQQLITFNKKRQVYEFGFYDANFSLKKIADIPKTPSEHAVIKTLSMAVSPLTIQELSRVMELCDYSLDEIFTLDDILSGLAHRGYISITRTEIEAVTATANVGILATTTTHEKQKIKNALSTVCRNTRPVEHAYYVVKDSALLERNEIKLIATAITADPLNRCVPLLLDEAEKKIPKRLFNSNELLQLHTSATAYYKAKCNVDSLTKVYSSVKKSHPRDYLLWSEYVLALIYALKRQQKYGEAIALGIKYLSRLGVRLPEHPTKLAIIGSYLKARAKLSQYPEPKPTQDKRILIINNVIEHIAGASYMAARSTLFSLLMSESVYICLSEGAAPESSFGLSAFAFVCRELSDISFALGSSNEAERILRYSKSYSKYSSRKYEARTNLIEYGFVTHWRICQREAANALFKTYETDGTTDPEYSLYSAAIGACLAFVRGFPLQELREKIDLPILHARHFGQATSLANMDIIAQFIELCADGEVTHVVDSEIPNLMLPWQVQISSKDKTVNSVFLTIRATLAVLDRDFQEAYRIVCLARSYSEGVRGQQLTTLMRFIESWCIAQLGSHGVSIFNLDENIAWYQNLTWFKKWMRDSPNNAQTYVMALQGLAQKNSRRRVVHLKIALESAKTDENWLLSSIIADTYMMQANAHSSREDSMRATIELINALDRWGAYARSATLKGSLRQPLGTHISDSKDVPIYTSINSLNNALNNSHYPSAALRNLISSMYENQGINCIEIYEFNMKHASLRRRHFKYNGQVSITESEIPDTPLHNEMLKIEEGNSFAINNRLVFGLYNDKTLAVALDLTTTGRVNPDDVTLRFSCNLLKLALSGNYLEDQVKVKEHQLKALSETHDTTEQSQRWANICSYVANHLERKNESMSNMLQKSMNSGEGYETNIPITAITAFQIDSRVIGATFKHLDRFSLVKPQKILFIYDQTPRHLIEIDIVESAGHIFHQSKCWSTDYQSLTEMSPQLIVCGLKEVGNLHDVTQQLSELAWDLKPLIMYIDYNLDTKAIPDGIFRKVLKSDATMIEWLLMAATEKKRPTLRSVSIHVV